MSLIQEDELLRISSRDSVEEIDGERAIYYGDLSVKTSFRYTRRLQFWTWGRSSGSIASGTLEIDNGEGRYDELVTLDLRNRPAELKVKVGNTLQSIVTPVIDSVEGVLDETIRIKLKDKLVLFDIPLNVPKFDSAADANVEGRSFPILIGVGRSIPPILWEANRDGGAYRITYSPLTGIGSVYDKGVRLDETATPPQWEFDSNIGNAGVVLENQTVGKITVDASATGDGILPPSPTDELGGDGDFTVSFSGATGPQTTPTTTGMPTNWSYRTRDSGIIGDASGWGWTHSSNGMRGSTGAAGNNVTGWIEAIYTGPVSTPFRFATGKTYRWTVKISSEVRGGFSIGFGNPQNPGYLEMYAGPRTASNSSLRNVVPSNRRINRWLAFSPTGEVGTYTGLFTAPSTANNEELIFRFGGSAASCRIESVEIIEVPEPSSISLPGVLLKDYVKEIFRLSNRPESLLELSDLDAIDPSAREMGYWTDKSVQALSMIRVPLDSYSADIYSDREGKIRFARMRDPSLETPDLEINTDNMKSRPRIYLDTAEGLTNQVGSRRNYYVHSESELAGSIVDLPLDERAKFINADQFSEELEVPLDWPEQYAHAVGANPLRTLYDDKTVASDELQRIIDIYAELRWFVEVEIYLDALDNLPDLNQIAEVTYPRYNLVDGRNMIIVKVEDILTGVERRQTAKLTLWG